MYVLLLQHFLQYVDKTKAQQSTLPLPRLNNNRESSFLTLSPKSFFNTISAKSFTASEWFESPTFHQRLASGKVERCSDVQ